MKKIHAHTHITECIYGKIGHLNLNRHFFTASINFYVMSLTDLGQFADKKEVIYFHEEKKIKYSKYAVEYLKTNLKCAILY